MARLVDPTKREAARQARLEQKREVLEAAREAFLREPYQRITLGTIAARAGVPEGSVSMLAGSREELLLRIAGEAVTRWCGVAVATLEASTPVDPPMLARLLARSVAADDELPRLLSLLPTAVECVAEPGPVALLVARVRDGLGRLVNAIRVACPGLAAGTVRAVPFCLFTAVTGLAPLARPVAGMASALADLDLSPFAVDLETELAAVLRGMLE